MAKKLPVRRKKKPKVRRKFLWWTLQWPNGEIDIDADDCLHLYRTKKRASQEVYDFDENSPPRPVKIRLVVEED